MILEVEGGESNNNGKNHTTGIGVWELTNAFYNLKPNVVVTIAEWIRDSL